MATQPGSTKIIGVYMVSIGREIGNFCNSYIYIRNNETGNAKRGISSLNVLTIKRYKAIKTVKYIKKITGGTL